MPGTISSWIASVIGTALVAVIGILWQRLWACQGKIQQMHEAENAELRERIKQRDVRIQKLQEHVE